MARKEYVSLRLPFESLERVEAYREKMQEQSRQSLSRSVVLRELIEIALEREGFGRKNHGA